ncbi:APC amino acid permease [Chytriomyces sp. MP71]|nr:APC amino acid permease [Chytriomyces sp. MP71]
MSQQADEALLAQLGYKQELKRELSSFTNYGVALSTICICSGLTSLFGFGLITGGPVVMTWGWLVVAFFTMIVGLAMAEICSAFPTSGGLYFWAAKLSRPQHQAFASWMTGWFNLLGQIAVSAGVVFGLALMIGAAASIASGLTYTPTPGVIVAIHIGICISIGMANSLGPKFMANLMFISTIWQVLTPFLLVVVTLAMAPTKQTATFVFTDFENNTGIESVPWVVLVGLLTAQFTFTGYDSSAHMTEETRSAAVGGPVGIVLAIGASTITGFVFIVGLLFAMQDYAGTISTVTGLPLAQILLDATNPNVALFLMIVNCICCWFACYSCLLANSRVIYAFSRDGAMPLSRLWHQIHPTAKIPFNANWLACFLYSILALPYLGNSAAFTAITSIATIGLYISYGIPIACKLFNPDLFEGHEGPFKLGQWSKPIGIVSLIWITIITALFVLPTTLPVTAVNMNYACVLVGAVMFGASGAYALSARHWFKGPVVNVEKDRSDAVLTASSVNQFKVSG